jgi:hypothetical protein
MIMPTPTCTAVPGSGNPDHALLAGRLDIVRHEPEATAEGARTDGSLGYELFRRAVCQDDQSAWSAIVTQYRGLVLSWLSRHTAWPYVRMLETDEYWITLTFERFWFAVRPERFHLFHSLGALLRYLKLCALSAIVDEIRARRGVHPEVPTEDIATLAEEGRDVQTLALGRLAGEALWGTIMEALPAEEDRLVVHLTLACHLAPREIQTRFPDRFPTVADVYRVKANVLARLQRSRAVRAFLM